MPSLKETYIVSYIVLTTILVIIIIIFIGYSKKQEDSFGARTSSSLRLNRALVSTPSSIQSMSAGTQLTVDSGTIRFVGDSGAVTSTATPLFTGPIEDNTCLDLWGTDDINTFTIQDEANLAGTGLQLEGNTNMTFGKGDSIEICWNESDGFFYEKERSVS